MADCPGPGQQPTELTVGDSSGQVYSARCERLDWTHTRLEHTLLNVKRNRNSGLMGAVYQVTAFLWKGLNTPP